MKPAPQEPITLSWRPIAPPPRRVVDGPLPEPLGHFYRRFDLTRFNRRSMMTDHRQTVFVCSNAKCGAVWDTDPHGHCPACMSNDGVGWSTAGQKVRSLPGQAVLQDLRDLIYEALQNSLDVNWNCSTGARYVADALLNAGLIAIPEDERGQWTCAARKQSLPEPADCNWPFCSCDPYANKVKDALEEARV